ncbi:glycerol-3-phosphate dehydrogenase subunit GlpB [Halostella sp. JP-L12]|uniref:glycerol-3-phosphate dehydrogenase subunit GlpB n=1 Tax=Halostella TaxID=1843185 RepID=UPI000EF7CDCE|nr:MULTISPECIES: glycerol-3-phosphate dehydrogenase subunit GlpB [Halostella]NHN48728.1 glycerol-3-phosphate dehydrogenase subunit GlpB [Halostella sp. JP-L12]
MAISDDVLVVGGGVAGVAAALAASDRADVRLISHKQSTLRSASGLVDALGYAPDGDGPIVDPFDAIDDLPEGHPYERVGKTAVREGFSLFDDTVGDMYRGSHTDTNALVPTHGGTVKPTARYPASAAAGLASDGRDALLVGFEALTDFDAPMAASHLDAAGVPFDARGVTVRFPGEFRADAKVTRYAHALDRDENLDGTPARTALAETVKRYLGDEERVGFPAVLGDDDPAGVRADLEAELGADVFEVPMGPPSLPGLRLEDRLYKALEEAGVRVESGNPAVGAETDGDRVEAVYVDRGRRKVPYHADQFVLATGGLVGKGIDSDRDGVREAVFDCYVPQPADRYDWFEDDAFDDHAFARFGVDVDRDLHPLTADGSIDYDNLRGAGSALGGYDFAAEKSGGGVSLATGYAAGDAAGAAVAGATDGATIHGDTQ